MRDDDPIARNIIDRQERVLRLAEVRGLTRAQLSAETGIPAATLASYADKPSRPAALMSLAAFVKLARVLPRDLASLLIEDSGLTLAAIEPEATNWTSLAGAAANFAGTVCGAMGDGRIDHREEAVLKGEARALIAKAADALA